MFSRLFGANNDSDTPDTNQSVTSALEQAIDAVVTIDQENLITFYNQAAENLWGYSPEEVLGKNVKLLVPSAIRSNHDNLVNANRNTGVDKIVGTFREVEVERKDGSTRWASLSLSKVRVGDQIHYTAFVRDITEERNSREFINQTLEQAIDAVITIDDQNRVQIFNKAAETLWGYDREEVIGENVKMLVPEELRLNHDNYVDTHRSTGVDKIVGSSREVEIQRKDGDRTWCNLALSRLQIGEQIHYTAFVRDISEEKNQRDFINQTIEQALDAIVAINHENKVTMFNKAAEALWGFNREEVIGKNVKMLVPMEIQADHDRLVNKNRETGVNRIVGTSREVEINRKDGKKLWGKLSLSKLKIGNQIHFTAFVQDVTEEVNRREEFRRLSLVANETDNSVVITNSHGEIQYVNPGFEKLTGYHPEEVIGKKPGSFLQGPDTDQETVRRIRAKLDAREAFYDEILNYDNQGNTYWISLAINPVFDSKGELENFISIQTNITETKLKSLEYNFKLDAIDRASASVEISLNGTVTHANKNYIQIFGYSDLNEVVGKDIKSFLDEEYANSDEFAELWHELESGGYSTGEFKHRAKDGSTVWLSGSFNPILDGSGKVSKFVMYCDDLTNRKQGIESISNVLSSLEEGNLTVRVNGEFDEELNLLRDSLNTSMTKLQTTMQDILEVTSNVAVGAQEISKGNNELSSRVESQASSLEETASTMEELTASSRNNTENAVAVNGRAGETGTAAQGGKTVVDNAVVAMEGISASSKKITDIIGVIDEIAFQTNLLALNAAVEAARAGEQGRGFAVVAGEVRNLAQRSAEAAKEIGALIKDSVVKVDEGTQLVNSSGETLDDITKQVLEVTRMVSEIAEASQSQLDGIQQANSAVASMDTITQQNAALVEEVTAASSNMLDSVDRMREDLRFFRTK